MTRLSYWKKKYLYAWKYSHVWKSVSLMLFALLVLSCRTTKVNTSARLTDNLTWNRKVSAALATVPHSLAELTVPMDSLRSLPPGASYRAKSGQAGLNIGYKDGNVLASASCDSLQQLVYILEEELHQARDRLEQKETIKEAPEFTLKCYLTGVLTGILTVLIFQFIRNGKIYLRRKAG